MLNALYMEVISNYKWKLPFCIQGQILALLHVLLLESRMLLPKGACLPSSEASDPPHHLFTFVFSLIVLI